ncbi:hypothetical protein ACN6QF_11635, partial [Acinetobacter baumannii]
VYTVLNHVIVSTVKIHKNQIEWREKNVLRNLCRMICAGLAICEQIPNVLLAHTLPRSSQNYK